MSGKKNKSSKSSKSSKSYKRSAYARKSRLLTFLLICALIVFAVGSVMFIFRPRALYTAAAELESQGKWAEAALRYDSLGTYEDSEHKAAYARCTAAFTAGKIKEGAKSFEALTEDEQQSVLDALHAESFTQLADSEAAAGNYENAYIYYTLDRSNPDNEDKIYTLDAYTSALALFDEGKYADAREALSSPAVLHGTQPDVDALINKCYEAEYEQYKALEDKDAALAIGKMSLIADEYEPARKYVSEFEEARSAALSFMTEGRYEDALIILSDMGSYSDCAYLAIDCRVLLAEQIARSEGIGAGLEALKAIDGWQAHLSALDDEDSLLLAALADDEA